MSGEKIPDDVMQAALECTREIFADPRAPIAPYIARAIMAERSARDERAAQIVERDAEDYWDVSCVAAAIRGEG